MSAPANPQSPAPVAPRWVPMIRNFEKERTSGLLTKEEVLEGQDPLSKVTTSSANLITKQQSVSNLSDSKSNVAPKSSPAKDPLSAPSDPLSQINDPLSASDPLSAPSDPLSRPAPASPVQRASSSLSVAAESKASKSVVSDADDNFIPWKSKKAAVLSEFTTDETLGVTVSFMDTESQGKAQAPVDRTQQRLAQIEQSEEHMMKQTLQMSQKEYEKHIEKLHQDLIQSWNTEERVKSLKIAIQCAKLLGDISVIKFYPSKFVIITEILDTFGKLVYERIAQKSVDKTDGKPRKMEYIPPELISEQARETCRNWFYKIASIRELLPRLYVEMAILRCYEFIQHNTFPIVINRICSLIRGVGDPLIALYARAYLARKGMEVTPDLKDYLISSFNDHIASLPVIKSPRFQTELTNYHVTMPEYLNLYSPALDWLLQCIGHNANMDLFNNILEKYKTCNNPIVLKHIISSFKPDFIASNAKLLTGMIRDAEETMPKYQLYAALGVNLVLSTPPKDQLLTILNEIWKVVTKVEDAKEYITVAEVYIEYPLKHLSPKEVNIMLADILRHVREGQAFEKLQPQLHSIVQKIVGHFSDFSKIFGMDNFIALLELFSGNIQIEVNKAILAAFSKNGELTSDPLIITAMFNIGKTVHDSVNALTFQDEIRQISKMLTNFVHKVDFGMDLEKHLNFFVECRRAFGNLDSVKYQLVIGACSLAMKTLTIVKGKHTKKTGPFVRACIAYCYITIPSMEDYFGRLNLFLLAGEVAMMNQALPQADSFFKSAIKLIQEVPPKIDNLSTEENLVNFVNSFLSLLIVVPGHPEQGPFYLIKGLLKVVVDYPWEKGSTAKGRILMSMLILFANYAQPKFPYKIVGVDSNDVLYGGDPDYLGEIQAIINKILEDILEEIAKLKNEDNETSDAAAKQSKMALDLFNCTITYAELTPKSATLAVKLFEIAKPNVDQAYLSNSLSALKSREGNLARELLKKLTGS